MQSETNHRVVGEIENNILIEKMKKNWKNNFELAIFKQMQTNSICIVGSTGLVGQSLKQLLIENHIEFDEYSRGQHTNYEWAFFCTPESVSKDLAPQFLKHGCKIIDASSAFRQSAPLIIPQINGHLIQDAPIIASPNCTATFLALSLFPLHKLFSLKNIVTSTYQAASGGGKKMLKEYEKGYDLRLHEGANNEEEEKMNFETQKILNAKFEMNTTCVRVYQKRVHALSIFATFEKQVDINQALKSIKHVDGIEYDANATIQSTENNSLVKIKRLRKANNPYSLELFVMGDQLLKGASQNMFEIFKSMQSHASLH